MSAALKRCRRPFKRPQAMAGQPAPVAHFVTRLPWLRNNADVAGVPLVLRKPSQELGQLIWSDWRKQLACLSFVQPLQNANSVCRPLTHCHGQRQGREGGIAYTLGIRCAHVRSRRPPPGLQARRFESLSQSAQALCSSPPINRPAWRAFLLAEREGFEPSVRVTVRLISSQVH